MKLKQLIDAIPDVIPTESPEVEVIGITSDSREVKPGYLFVAKRGGSAFISQALAAGAVAISHSDTPLARYFFDDPASELFLVGITGTNGKTTSSYLIKHVLDALQGPCGLIGTIEWIMGQERFPSTHTTPDLIANHRLFREMRVKNCTSCVMEVSSHALDQGRVAGINYDRVVFTNLTPDHLDYHLTMESYADAKAALFFPIASSKSRIAIVNGDCPWHKRILHACKDPVILYGIDHPSCAVRGESLRMSASGMTFSVAYEGQKEELHTPLIGRFNVYNCLGAIALGLSLGASLATVVEILSRFSTVPGRMERVKHPIPVFVDYAHTEDALDNVLKTLRELKPRRLIVVFGCGGNRDTLKRPKMGAVVERLADVAVVTSDNSRQEDPREIIRQILTGFQHPERAEVIVDRKEAIERAISMATPDDIVLIAGKGHETTPFDDRVIARQCS